MDSKEEDSYNEIVHLASKISGTSIATISFLDDQRKWFKYKIGINFIICIFLNIEIVYGQQQTIVDSLLQTLNTSVSKKEQVDVYVKLAEMYRNNDSITTVNYANQAIELAKDSEYKEGIIDAELQVAILNAILGNYPKAINLFEKVVKGAELANYPKGKLLGLNGLGNISKFQGNLDKALEYLKQSFKIAEEMDDKRGMEISLNNIGLIYSNQGAYARFLIVLSS